MRMKVGSLFSGIGGLDLGLERAGMEIRWQVEIDDYCQRVLEKHWPHVPKYGDIRGLRGDELEPVDLICGGFPCQPFSVAGKRRGQADDRYLWPEMFRIIKALRPRWVLGENVAGIVNMVLDAVLSDLESEGYETATFVIPACAVGAPHRRDRVWIVAHAESEQDRRLQQAGFFSNAGTNGQDVAHTSCQLPHRSRSTRATRRCEFADCGQNVAHATGQRLEDLCGLFGRSARSYATTEIYDDRPTQSRLGLLLNGLSSRLAGHRWPAPLGCEQYEWEPPRVTTEKVPYRRQKLQALGNAVVPQAAEVIGRAIIKAERRR